MCDICQIELEPRKFESHMQKNHGANKPQTKDEEIPEVIQNEFHKENMKYCDFCQKFITIANFSRHMGITHGQGWGKVNFKSSTHTQNSRFCL
jgi:hypothetical protein